MKKNTRSRASLICWCLVLFDSSSCHAVGDIFQRVSSVRSLPSVLIKGTSPVFNRRRSRRSSWNRVDLVASIKSRLKTTGYYYGIPQTLVSPLTPRKPTQKETLDMLMNSALAELKGMREEMLALRKDVKDMKRQLGHEEDEEDTDDQPLPLLAKLKHQREWDKVAMDIEKWAESLLFQDGSQEEEDGWKEIKVSKLCAHYNKDNQIRCYMKWMKDSRGEHATADDELEYPCIKLYATLDSPMEKVCEYLSEESTLPEYNVLVVKHQDLEEISPHSKICWGQSPKIMFIKPRDFVTFCHHRWLRDGTQVVVNQACNHEDFSKAMKKTDAQAGLKAFALRGANFLSPHPDDPNKTRFALVSHANPGPDISSWMCRAAVNTLAPIEPFKLCHNINKCVQRYERNPNRTQLVSSSPGRSTRPAGLSQMGYACFWPKGGGLKEGFIHGQHPDQVDPSEHEHRNENLNEQEEE